MAKPEDLTICYSKDQIKIYCICGWQSKREVVPETFHICNTKVHHGTS